MGPSVVERVKYELREFFLLEGTTQRLASRSPQDQESIRALHDAALRRLRAAQALRGPDLTPAAMSLYQQAGLLLAQASLVSSGGATDAALLGPDVAFNKLDEALAKEKSAPPAEFVDSKPFLLSSDLLQLDRLPTEEAEGVVAKLDASTRWLAGRVDPRSPRELRLTSMARIAAAVLVALMLLAFLGRKIFAPKNLALHRPATSSSVALSTSPEGAVDGSKNGRFGFHSGEEDSPWWTVDLGEPIELTEIRVYGRGDCCFDQSVPLALELSTDGTSYHEFNRRSEGLSESDPWVIKMGDVARFVRLRSTRRTYLVLSEVEVNGQRSK
jgi:hypothetical protein